jgi:uncharacterized RDD family membrane protein YckC
MEDLLADIDVQPKLARKSRRWAAAAIDYFIYLLIVGILAFVFGEPVPDESDSVTYSLTGWPAFFSIMTTWFFILPGIEGMNNGQTIGKAILRLRAVREDNGKFTLGTAVARHILDFVDYFPFFGIVGLIVASNSKNNKRVGDMIGKTIVVDAQSAPFV